MAAANAPARAFGISEGLGFADARARAPDLASEDIDRSGDARALARLAGWMIRLAPLVAVDGRDGLMIETTGCAHLYGGEAAMLDKVAALFTRQALPHRLGLAGTQGAASALARAAPGTMLAESEEAAGLAGLPVSALRLSEEAVTRLRRFGLTRIGQLYGIDRKALARRFQSREAADAVLLRLDQALGLRLEPLKPLRPAPLHAVRMSCPEPLLTREAIELGLERLAEALCADLSSQGEGARGFAFHAFRADGGASCVEITLARPARRPAHILKLFAERLDRLDPGFGIDLLVLEARRPGPMEPHAAALSGDLAAGETDEVALSALADRISVKLGEGAVTVVHPVASHLPERAEDRRVFEGTLPQPAATLSVCGPRPIRLFVQPERVEVIAEVPDGPPQRFIWRRVPRRVVRADGPERIAPEWWAHRAPPPSALSPDGADRKWLAPKLDPRADADLIRTIRTELETAEVGERVRNLPRARDYYRVEDTEGRRYWLFRDGLYGDGRGGAPDWYVHGLFA